MHTDAKIGFAIGGVLLAVLTVYAIVVPKHKKTNNGTVALVTTPGSSSTVADTTPASPPIAAADTGSSSPAISVLAKDPTPAQPTTPTIPTPQVVDNTGGAGPASTDGFHPLLMPKDTPKADEQKSAMLHDGVYTPEGSTPRVAKVKRSDLSPLPDESDVVSTSSDTLYAIKSGQTLSKIAYEVYGNSRFWVVIQRENKGLDANHLKVGSKIKLPDISSVVPGPVTVSDEEVMPSMAAASTPHRATPEVATTDARTYTVKSGDSLYGIAKRLLGTGRKADALYTLNKEVIGPDKSKLKLGEVLKLPQAAN